LSGVFKLETTKLIKSDTYNLGTAQHGRTLTSHGNGYGTRLAIAQ
jgi:hypothetical protein